MATSRICSIPDCGKSVRSRGLCSAHYSRFRRYGSTDARRAPDGAGASFIADALKSETDDCILWPYYKRNGGYGAATVDGTFVAAHRYVCEQTHGPSDLYACHKCGVPACINPRHLRWGTNAENQADAIAHGTTRVGSRHPGAKLTEENVRTIRRGGKRLCDFARMFGVSEQTIRIVRDRKRWKHVI